MHHRRFNNRDEARTAIFYNRQRRHQLLDYVSPVEYEGRELLLNLLSVKSGLAQPDPQTYSQQYGFTLHRRH